METSFGTFYPSDDIGERKLPDNTAYLEQHNIWRAGSERARALGRSFRDALDAGRTVHLLGFLGTSHNSGVALVEASRAGGIVTVANCEEERFCALKHHSGYPAHSVREIARILKRRGVPASDVFAVLYAFDVVHEEQGALSALLMNPKVVRGHQFRKYLDSVKPETTLREDEAQQMRRNMFSHAPHLVNVFRSLACDLGLPTATPCIQMLHHESHAAVAYAQSPFGKAERRGRATLIACVDGGGDLSSISTFKTRDGEIEPLRRNRRVNSLETFYMLCAIALGGWTALNVEGDARSDNRFMAAAALGNLSRMTNPFYRQLRQYFHFAPGGECFVNALMADDSLSGLEKVVGPFYAEAGDRKVDPARLSRDLPMTQRRLDVAAAVQLVFEDVLFHLVGAAIQETGADQLVLCGQAAMNGMANAALLEHFDASYYAHYELGETRLKLWVPPVAADPGAVAGAAYRFAMSNAALTDTESPIAFGCGMAPGIEEVDRAIAQAPGIRSQAAENPAEQIAKLVAGGEAVGIFQGAAENGARALGHRSILFDPCDPGARTIVNREVKQRESIRPLSVMVTLDDAPNWFELSGGASAADFDAYGYMLIDARATDAARRKMPSTVNAAGFSRIQIVRPDANPLIFAVLKAVGRRTGAEAAINTSLNVGTPIVQTPEQALAIFSRGSRLDCLVFVGSEGGARLVRRDTVHGPARQELFCEVE